MYKILLGSFFVVFISGCSVGYEKLDISKYEIIDKDYRTVEKLDVCKSYYENKKYSVAVAQFTNNSSFTTADVIVTSGDINYKQKKTGVGFVLPIGALVGAGVVNTKGKIEYKSATQSTSPDAKLSESITDIVEGKISLTGGMDLISRTDLSKVLEEQNFQNSGMVDEDSVVEIGKISGVKYLITGSINSVKQEYTKPVNVNTGKISKDKDVAKIQMALEVTKFAYNAISSGMNIKTNITIKIIDTQNAKIVFSKNYSGNSNIGEISNPTFEQVVGGIKSSILISTADFENDIKDIFTQKGYIVSIRSNKNEKIALISLGKDDNIKIGDTFLILNMAEIKDPISQKRVCDITKTDTKIIISNQIQQKRSWGYVDGEDKNIKTGQLIESTQNDD